VNELGIPSAGFESGTLWDDRTALFSDDRLYRYQLWRGWDESRAPVMFIGLNPSTADALDDDNNGERTWRVWLVTHWCA
jgi:hypothetical protein